MANQTTFNYPMSLGGKAVPGRILIDYDNGNAEWFAGGDTYPTFKSSKDTGGVGKWGWTPATNTSVENLRNNEYVTGRGLNYTDDTALLNDFYTGNSIAGLNNQRAYAFNKNYPATGRIIGVPGVRNSSGAQQPPKPTDPAPAAPGVPTPASPTAPDGGPTSTPASTGAKPTIPQDTNTSIIAVYPLKMGTTKQDRIKFTALEYQASGDLSTGNIAERDRTSSLKGRKPLGHVFLPIQASITDANSVDWQGAGLNAIERSTVNLSSALMNAQTKEAVDTELQKSTTDALNKVIASGREIKVALAGEAVGIQNLLGRFGSVLNPNLELLFSGPQLRPFEFRFQMSARERDEAANIKKIINFFKKNMAPRTTEGNIFLRAPNTFLIEYKYDGAEKEHQGINKIKECALLNCSVDYTPLGTYMTYDDGTMVSYAMTLSFQELEPVYDKDYKDGHSIGY
jgi:hypothetical protein